MGETSRIMTEEQIRRYSRHLILPEVGGAGQRKLLNSRVLLIGAGGLGSPVALYLAAAGVGTLGIVDFDVVDLSNLQRQILHHGHDLGRPKVESAIDTIGDLNPDVKVIPYPEALSSENARRILADFDVVVNGCDNFPTPVPGQRRVRLSREADGGREYLQIRGASHGLLAGAWMLSVSLSGAAAARGGAQLRRGRSAGRGVRCHRVHPRGGDDQAPLGTGGAAGRPPGVLRRTGDGIPPGQVPSRPRLPGLRRSSDDHRPDRLPRVLRGSPAHEERYADAVPNTGNVPRSHPWCWARPASSSASSWPYSGPTRPSWSWPSPSLGSWQWSSGASASRAPRRGMARAGTWRWVGPAI